MVFSRKYTDEDEIIFTEYIKSNHKTMMQKDICEHLGISQHIYNKICDKNGIPRLLKKVQDWEVIFIRLAHPPFSLEEIGNVLGRTRSSIHNITVSLDIRKKRKNNKLYIGFKQGALTIEEQSGKSKSGQNLWLCHCSLCGNKRKFTTAQINYNQLENCGCRTSKNTLYTKSFYGINPDAVNRVYRNAERIKRPCNVTKEYMEQLFVDQDFRCALTGIKLHISTPGNNRNRIKQTASLDRIDSNEGYLFGNVQWLHKDVNKIKQNLKQDYFLILCTLIYLKNKKYIINNLAKKRQNPYSFKKKTYKGHLLNEPDQETTQ